MEYMKLAVVTDDRPYGEAVCRSLLIGNRNFDLTLFTCLHFCEQWKKQGQSFRDGFDLILWDWEGLCWVYGGNIVWLTERRSISIRDGEGRADRHQIWKYSSSSEMTAAVFSIYEMRTGRRPVGKRPDHVQVIAFASWQGGCGCSTLAFASGQELVRTWRQRVLYLSFEGVESGLPAKEQQMNMKSMREYLYHLQAEESALPAIGPASPGGSYLEEYLVRDGYGLQAFAPSEGANPLPSLTGQDTARLMTSLMTSGRFDVILLDIGSATGAAASEALGYADKICLVSDRPDRKREERYRKYLRHGTGSGKEDKAVREDRVIRVRTRCPGIKQENNSVSIAARSGTDPQLLLEGQFGKDVHKLVKVWYDKNVN